MPRPSASEWRRLAKVLHKTLKEASDHLDYCGYGDSWERECAQASKLEQKITKALDKAEEMKL